MKLEIHSITQLCALSLGIFVICNIQTHAKPPQFYTEAITTPVISSRGAILDELVKADVVYLGETHNNPDDHKAQLEILQALHQRNPKIAIAMEMFQRPYQSIIDRYLAGELTEAELIEQTEYEKRWGFPWEYYAPLLRFAKDNKLPVLALNTPTEITRKVARHGLESLTLDEQKHIPPLTEIRTDNPDYRKMIQEIYEQHQEGSHGNSTSFERFFTTQVLWDETMAETIAQFIIANPDYQVVAIAGKGHIIYGYGIPSRVARRINTPDFLQYSLLFGVAEDGKLDGENRIADFFWK
ncbi:ChaN family lipoprotein [Limnofasciculus baicalensis]|uniref:ChaN family lipoprotein n=1 Tax=Limnofasciculus baicalensis BBK-W-15 TaxID=2699891 RepID=A0AAE3KJW8_9CYAN|nr:ChaN family lipoprotein [Limnofasciculus baicalensis]MCP2726975.1 ChaN family lipoprotein [Limnofasciculus baicalensis BBK-W-15]